MRRFPAVSLGLILAGCAGDPLPNGGDGGTGGTGGGGGNGGSPGDASADSLPGCGRGVACPPNRFCDMGCPSSDRGLCVEIPGICPRIFMPVCGCDGKTYGNDCARQMAAVSLRHEGPCDSPPPDAGTVDAGTTCPAGMFWCPCTKTCYSQACGACCMFCEPDAGTGDRCSESAGVLCPDGQFCEYEPMMCGAADLTGICEPRPKICPQLYKPVCGCDGVTYGNDCERKGAGARKNHDGPC